MLALLVGHIWVTLSMIAYSVTVLHAGCPLDFLIKRSQSLFSSS